MRRSLVVRLVALVCVLAAIAAWSVYAQQIWVGGYRNDPPRWPKACR